MANDVLAAMEPLPDTKIINWALPESAYLPENRHTLIEVARIFGSITIGLETMTEEIIRAAVDACREVGRFGPMPWLYLKWSPLHNCEAIPDRWPKNLAPNQNDWHFWDEVLRFFKWWDMVSVAVDEGVFVAGFLIDREAIKVSPDDDEWNANLLQMQRTFDSMIAARYDVPRYVYMLGESGQFNMTDSPGNKGTRLYFPLAPDDQLQRLNGWATKPDFADDRAVFVSIGCGYEGSPDVQGPWNNHLEVPLEHYRNLGRAFADGPTNVAAIVYPSILGADVWNPIECFAAFAEGAGS